MSNRDKLTPFQRSISSDAENRHADDFYATHPAAAHALVEAMGWRGLYFWEPACGDGSLARGLIDAGMRQALATDLRYRGYGRGGVDFLLEMHRRCRLESPIITNPPYKIWVKFALVALRSWGGENRTLALYGPDRLLSGGVKGGAAARAALFRECPPAWVLTFDRRIPVARGGDWSLAASPMNTDAWFVWLPGVRETRWRMISPRIPPGAWQPQMPGRRPW